jgi:hypothetical protein
MPLAFMPQHTWQVGAGVLALSIAVAGTRELARHRSPIGAVVLAVAVGVGVAAALLPAEPGYQYGSSWGGTTGVVFLAVWVVLILVASVAEWRQRSRQ